MAAPVNVAAAAAAPSPACVSSHQLSLLQAAFSTAPIDAIKRAIAKNRFDAGAAFNELSTWSLVELQQPLKDKEGREIFTWRVPLEQCEANSGTARTTSAA